MKKILLLSAVFLAACSQAETTTQQTPQAELSAKAEQQSKTETKAAAAPAKPNITTQDLGGGFYMLLGPGGNIGVSTGDDGVYMIDDKFARFGRKSSMLSGHCQTSQSHMF